MDKDALFYASNQTNRSPGQEWQKWETFCHFPRCHRHQPASPEDSNTEMIISMIFLCYLYHYQISIEKGEDLLYGEIDAMKSSLQPLADGRHLKGLIFRTGCHVYRHIIQQLAMRFLFQQSRDVLGRHAAGASCDSLSCLGLHRVYRGAKAGRCDHPSPKPTGTGHLYCNWRIPRQLTDHLDLGHQ